MAARAGLAPARVLPPLGFRDRDNTILSPSLVLRLKFFGCCSMTVAILMYAYLFTAWTRSSASRQSADMCRSLIVYGGTAEVARARFESWVQTPVQGAESDEVEKIIGVQLIDGLFTEDGRVPIDWPQVRTETEIPESPESDQMEKGYWADCNSLVDPEKLSSDLDALRGELPEDLSSGLNWSADKQYFYVISVLKPWLVDDPSVPTADDATSETSAADRDPDSDDIEKAEFIESQQPPTLELAEKQTAALVRARNSVVAAWLWRKHAAGTPLAKHPILMDPWCGAIPVEDDPDDPNNTPETPAS
jgi:hypothetical protein